MNNGYIYIQIPIDQWYLDSIFEQMEADEKYNGINTECTRHSALCIHWINNSEILLRLEPALYSITARRSFSKKEPTCL